MGSSSSTHLGSNTSIPTGSTPPSHMGSSTSTLMSSSLCGYVLSIPPLLGLSPISPVGSHGWDGCWTPAHTEAGDGPMQV